MFFMGQAAAAVLMCGIGYRLRGGGFITFGGDFMPRLIWAIAFMLSYCVMDWGHINPIAAAWFLPGAFLAVALIPHAYCQQMGRGAVPNSNPLKKRWPTCWLPQPSAATWAAWSSWQRMDYDWLQMLVVVLLRALIIFGPFLYLSPIRVGISIITAALLSPTVYCIGWFIPFSLPQVTKKSTEWGEFLTGAVAWAGALIVAVL